MTKDDTQGAHSGQLRVRLPVELHTALAAEARQQKISLNTLIIALLAPSINWKEGMTRMSASTYTNSAPKTARRYGRDDLKRADPIERRYALAYLRWLAAGDDRRERKPTYSHPAYNKDFTLTEDRALEIETQIEAMVLDAVQATLRLVRGRPVVAP